MSRDLDWPCFSFNESSPYNMYMYACIQRDECIRSSGCNVLINIYSYDVRDILSCPIIALPDISTQVWMDSVKSDTIWYVCLRYLIITQS